MSLRGVDLLALTVLWGVLLIGAVLIASVGGEVFALAVLWLVVLMGAVLLASLGVDDTRNADGDDAVEASAPAFIMSGLLGLTYVTDAALALRGGVVAAFLTGGCLAAVFLLVRHLRRAHAAPLTSGLERTCAKVQSRARATRASHDRSDQAKNASTERGGVEPTEPWATRPHWF